MDKPSLIQRLQDEADQCRNDGADDVARLLDEAASELTRQLATLEAAVEQANARQNASWSLMCEKMVAAERERWETPTSMDCASCEYVAPTRHEQCKGCEREVTVHRNYKRASWD